MTDFLKIAKSIVVHFAHICAYSVETVRTNRALDTEEQRKERLRIRRENQKIEHHEKQHLVTLKRLKRGDNNELKRNLKLEKVVAGKPLRLAVKKKEEQDWRMMQLF